MAKTQGFNCYALSVDYGQRHHSELAAALLVSQMLGAREHRVVNIDLTGFGGSALTDSSIAVPEQEEPLDELAGLATLAGVAAESGVGALTASPPRVANAVQGVV